MSAKEKIKDFLRPLYHSACVLIYAGNKCECNLCGRRYRRMRPICGRNQEGSLVVLERSGCSCWKCMSYPRARALWLWLTKEFGLSSRPELQVLHVASEEALARRFRKVKNIAYTVIDKKCPGYSYPDYVRDGDILQLEFADDSFDLVICNHVLEHIKDDRRAMHELYRVCRPGGTAILMVSMDSDRMQTEEEGADEQLSPAERLARFGQRDHVRIYGRDYFYRLAEVGFKVERITFSEEENSRYALLPWEEVVVAVKPIS